MSLINVLIILAGLGMFSFFALRAVTMFPLRPPIPQQIYYQPQPIAAPTTTPVTDAEEESAESSQTPASTISPTPPVGQVLYDSNKGWSGVKTAASGSPKWSESGGIGRLSSGSGFGRVYISVNNYNSRMESEFMFESGQIDTLSLRLRSRHNEGGACSNRFGGFGASIKPGGELGFQTESCHNNHENSISGRLPKPLQQGKWYKFAYSVYDAPDKKSVNFKLEFDYGDGQGLKTYLTGKHASPQAYYMDEKTLMSKSYVWLRTNRSGSGVTAFKNFRVTAIGSGNSVAALGTTTELFYPYLFNSYFNRRRL